MFRLWAIFLLVLTLQGFNALAADLPPPTGNSFLDKVNAWEASEEPGLVQQQLSRTYYQEQMISELKNAANQVSHQVNELNRWSTQGAEGLSKMSTEDVTQALNRYEQLNRVALRYLNNPNFKGSVAQMSVTSKPGAEPGTWKTELSIKFGKEPAKVTEISKQAFDELSKKNLLKPGLDRPERKTFELSARAALSAPGAHEPKVGVNPIEQYSNPLDIIGAIR